MPENRSEEQKRIEEMSFFDLLNSADFFGQDFWPRWQGSSVQDQFGNIMSAEEQVPQDYNPEESFLDGLMKNLGIGVNNAVVGTREMVKNPVDTVKGLGSMAATYGQGAVSYLPGVGDLMKLGMTPERFEEVQAPIIDAAVAGRDLITDPAAMANMAYKYPLEVGGTLAGIPSLVREGGNFFRAPETWDPYDGHVDVPNIVNMDDPVWVNVYDRLVSGELMPDELVSQMRADGNSEMYIDAVLVEMEELMETRAGEIRNFLRSVVEPTPATPGLINTADNIDYGPTLEQMIPADPVYLPFPDVDDPTRPALTTLDVEEIAAEAEAAGPPPALLDVDDTLAEAGFDGVPTQDMHYDQLMQTDMGPQDLVDNMVASGLNPTRITEELVALRHRARDEYLVTGSLFAEEMGNELASFIERRQLDLPETVPTQQQLWQGVDDTLEDINLDDLPDDDALEDFSYLDLPETVPTPAPAMMTPAVTQQLLDTLDDGYTAPDFLPDQMLENLAAAVNNQPELTTQQMLEGPNPAPPLVLRPPEATTAANFVHPEFRPYQHQLRETVIRAATDGTLDDLYHQMASMGTPDTAFDQISRFGLQAAEQFPDAGLSGLIEQWAQKGKPVASRTSKLTDAKVIFSALNDIDILDPDAAGAFSPTAQSGALVNAFKDRLPAKFESKEQLVAALGKLGPDAVRPHDLDIFSNRLDTEDLFANGPVTKAQAFEALMQSTDSALDVTKMTGKQTKWHGNFFEQGKLRSRGIDIGEFYDYSENVLSIPDPVGVTANQGGLVHPARKHWEAEAIPGAPIAWWRSTVFKGQNKPPVYVLGEAQSDWQQKIRKFAKTPEAATAELTSLQSKADVKIDRANKVTRRLEELRGERISALDNSRPSIHQLDDGTAVTRPKSSTQLQNELRKEELDIEIQALGLERQKLKAEMKDLDTRALELKDNPALNEMGWTPKIVGSDKAEWVSTVAKQALLDAVNKGLDTIAIPSGEKVKGYTMGEISGQNAFYGDVEKLKADPFAREGQLPNSMENALNAIAKKVLGSRNTFMEGFVNDRGFERVNVNIEGVGWVTQFKLDPKLIAALKEEGIAAYKKGGIVSGSLLDIDIFG